MEGILRGRAQKKARAEGLALAAFAILSIPGARWGGAGIAWAYAAAMWVYAAGFGRDGLTALGWGRVSKPRASAALESPSPAEVVRPRGAGRPFGVDDGEAMESDRVSMFDPGWWLALLWRWKSLILLSALATGAAALVAVLLVTPTYEAQAGVAIIKSSTQMTLDSRLRTTSEVDSFAYTDPGARQDLLVQLVKNPQIAEGVIERMGDGLQKAMRVPGVLVRSIRGSNDGDFILIRARAKTPALAAALATAWAQEYEIYVNGLYSGGVFTLPELEAKAEAARAEFEAAEAALTAYIADNPVGGLSQQLAETQKIIDAHLTARLTAIADLYEVRSRLDRLIADATSLRGQIASGEGSGAPGTELAMLVLEINAFNTSLDDSALTRLNAPASLQITVEQLSSGTTAAEQIARLDSLIAALQERRRALQADAEARAEELASAAPDDPMRESIVALIVQANRLQEQLEAESATKQELIRARDLAWNAYATLAAKVVEGDILAEERGALVRMAVPATVPVAPGWLQSSLRVLLALAVGGVAGMGLAFGLDVLDRRVRTEAQVERHLGLPAVGAVPDLSRSAGGRGRGAPRASMPFSLNGDTAAGGVFSLVRQNLIGSGRTWRVLAVSSAMPGEGNSTVAASLAVRWAQAGQTVLLVDADLRRPALHRLFEVDNTAGLAEILSGDAAAWQSLARATSVPGLSLVTSGAPPKDAATLLETPALARWLEQAREAADVVIVDTPAALGVADSTIVARRADAILMVVAADQTLPETAVRAKARLTATGVPLAGVVLNRADPDMTSLPYMGHYRTPPDGLMGKRRGSD